MVSKGYYSDILKINYTKQKDIQGRWLNYTGEVPVIHKIKKPNIHTKYFIYKSVLSDVHWYIERSIYFKCIKMSKT